MLNCYDARRGCGAESSQPWLDDSPGSQLVISPHAVKFSLPPTSDSAQGGSSPDAGGALPAPIPFTVIGYFGADDATNPTATPHGSQLAEGAHVIVTLVKGDAGDAGDAHDAGNASQPDDVTLLSSAEKGCIPLSGGALDCVLLADGTAKFEAQVTNPHATGISTITVASPLGSNVKDQAVITFDTDLQQATLNILGLEAGSTGMTIPVKKSSGILRCTPPEATAACDDVPSFRRRLANAFNVEIDQKSTGKKFDLVDAPRQYIALHVSKNAWVDASSDCDRSDPHVPLLAPVDPGTSRTGPLYVCANGGSGVYRVLAEISTLSAASDEITVLPQPAYLTLIQGEPSSSGHKRQLTAQLNACNGDGIPDQNLNFTSTGNSFTFDPVPPPGTNAAGMVSVTATADAEGTYDVKVTVTDTQEPCNFAKVSVQ